VEAPPEAGRMPSRGRRARSWRHTAEAVEERLAERSERAWNRAALASPSPSRGTIAVPCRGLLLVFRERASLALRLDYPVVADGRVVAPT